MSIAGFQAGTRVGTHAGTEAGEVAGQVGEVTVTGVDATATGTTDIGDIIAEALTHPRLAVDITPDSLDASVEYNIQVDGNDLFSSEQSSDSNNNAVELTPDQNKQVTGEYVHDYAVDVSTANATAGTLDITVKGLE